MSYLGKPYDHTFRGIVAELDGRVVGIAGVLHLPIPQAVSTMDDVMRKHPKVIMRAARRVVDIIKTYTVPIYATASTSEKNAPRLLTHLGFVDIGGGLYQWHKQPSR